MKIELAKKEIIHFIGIGGIGMSGLSLIMKGKGFRVQGSDIKNNKTCIFIRIKSGYVKIFNLNVLEFINLKNFINLPN